MSVRLIRLLTALAVTLAVAAPAILALLLTAGLPPRFQTRLKGLIFQTWGRALCRAMRIKVRIHGTLPAEAERLFLVANHCSYLDIAVLASVLTLSFVSKHDVARWPGIGLLARMIGTIFVNRAKPLSSRALVDSVVRSLERGARVLVFPEGTSTSGQGMLPFKTGLFEAPARAGAVIQPLLIRYSALNRRPLTPETRDLICWYDGTAFGEHAWRLLAAGPIEADVFFCRPVPPSASRKSLAASARSSLEEHFRPLIRSSHA